MRNNVNVALPLVSCVAVALTVEARATEPYAFCPLQSNPLTSSCSPSFHNPLRSI